MKIVCIIVINDARRSARGPHPVDDLLSEDVNLLDLDLNLLIALDALLTEQSVTRAADRLVRSQPALSASLKRLRHQFRDDLLIRVGNHYELTPLATQLKGRVGLVLADIGRVFATRSRFDPEHSDREFVVVTSDHGLAVLGQTLARILTRVAPGIHLRFLQLTDHVVDSGENALRAVDGVFLPHGFLHDLPHLDAYRDRWMCLVSADNELVGEALTLDALSRLEWVLAFHRPRATLPPVRQLQLLGVEMNVAVSIDGFLALPAFVAGTNRVAFIQKQLARRVAASPELRILSCPFDVVPLAEAFWWHPTLEHDPGHIWFRSVIRQAGASLASPD